MENVGGMKLDERGKPRKIQKIPILPITTVHLATPRLEFRTSVGTDEQPNPSDASTTNLSYIPSFTAFGSAVTRETETHGNTGLYIKSLKNRAGFQSIGKLLLIGL